MLSQWKVAKDKTQLEAKMLKYSQITPSSTPKTTRYYPSQGFQGLPPNTYLPIFSYGCTRHGLIFCSTHLRMNAGSKARISDSHSSWCSLTLSAAVLSSDSSPSFVQCLSACECNQRLHTRFTPCCTGIPACNDISSRFPSGICE